MDTASSKSASSSSGYGPAGVESSSANSSTTESRSAGTDNRESALFQRELRNTGIASQFLSLTLVTAGYLAFTNELSWQRVVAMPIIFVLLTPIFSFFMHRVSVWSYKELHAILDDPSNPAVRPSTPEAELKLLKKLTDAPWIVSLGTAMIWLTFAPVSLYGIECYTSTSKHGFMPLLLAILACIPAIALCQVLRIELLQRPYIAKAQIGHVDDLAKLPLALTIRKRLMFSIGLIGPYSLTLFAVLTYLQLSTSATVQEALAKFLSLQLFFVAASTGLSFLCVYYLMRVVNQPLEQIRQALSNSGNEQSTQTAHALDEFGVVARLIVERNALEHAKQEFFAMVGHEVRSPIMSIKTFLGLLAEGAYGALPERVQKKAATAEQNAARLVRLINNILDAEKLQAGKFECIFKTTDTQAIVDRAIRSVSDLAEREGVEVIVDCQPQLVVCDEERMVQVMVNFLSNAIKNSAGKPVVAKALAKGELIEFGVQDEGAGIAVDLQQQVFEKFKQLASARESGMKGTGIGLPIAKALVEQHGGMIGVESEPGKGSYFWARIPRQQQQDFLAKFQRDA